MVQKMYEGMSFKYLIYTPRLHYTTIPMQVWNDNCKLQNRCHLFCVICIFYVISFILLLYLLFSAIPSSDTKMKVFSLPIT